MESYANAGGDSGVVAYEVGDDSIAVQFKGGAEYLYNYASTGQANVEQMKKLARAGQGLNSYISRVVKKAYARKLR